jgi:hypothetical protein
MSISLRTCYLCDAVFEEASSVSQCEVCKLRQEMEAKIEELHDLIRNFHPLE